MKKPRYFCEHCGAEVNRNDAACPACGRFFSSVKCPRCGYTGVPALFKKGCPVCGYSAPSGDGSVKKAAPAPASPLPNWIYFLALAALVIALTVFLLTAR